LGNALDSYNAHLAKVKSQGLDRPLDRSGWAPAQLRAELQSALDGSEELARLCIDGYDEALKEAESGGMRGRRARLDEARAEWLPRCDYVAHQREFLRLSLQLSDERFGSDGDTTS
jgi:hypothetical protein